MPSTGRIPLAVAGGLLLSACGLNPPDPAPFLANCSTFLREQPPAADNLVYFMTTRLPDCRNSLLSLGNYRHPQASFGASTPLDPASNDWARHQSVFLPESAWEDGVRQAAATTGNGRVLIFVHGYFNDFVDAIERTAILRDLHADDVPAVAVSWPSRNRAQGYSQDEASVAWAQDYFDVVLVRLVEMQEVEGVTIIAHSMGSRALLDAVERLDLIRPDLAHKVDKLVLASPDVDRDRTLRRNGVIERLLQVPNRRVLVYASDRDIAVGAGRIVHGYARLGTTACEHDVVYARRSQTPDNACHLAFAHDRLSVVDTEAVDDASSLDRHADFIESCVVRRDLAAFLADAETPWRVQITEEGGERIGYRIDPQDARVASGCAQ